MSLVEIWPLFIFLSFTFLTFALSKVAKLDLSFSFCVILLLTVPLAFLLNQIGLGNSVNQIALYSSVLLTLFFGKILFRPSTDYTDLKTPGYFIAIFSILYFLNLLWPDFYPMGERLRDYALVSQGVRDPLSNVDPWSVSVESNYYLFWYRLGGLLAGSLSLQTWEIYHLLAALAPACYWLWCAKLLELLGVKKLPAALGAVACTFASNLKGIYFALAGSHDWWGPSRAIVNAITEFPVWSFLLGDLHPHFLSLWILPFILCCSITVIRDRSLPGALLLLTVPLLIYGMNAWELPALALAGVVIFVAEKGWNIFKFTQKSKIQIILGLFVLLVVAFGLYLNMRHIAAPSYPWRLVTNQIGWTPVDQFFQHWGIHFALLSVVLAFVLPAFGVASIICLSLLTSQLNFFPALFLSAIIAALLYATFYKTKCKVNLNISALVICLAGLFLILLPEIIFLDDPYGGEHERMNTIFKFYVPAWTLLSIGCISLLQGLNINYKWYPYSLLTLLALSILFFIRTIPIRVSTPPHDPKGLSAVEREFPGAKETIEILQQTPDAVVLEGDNGAYSWATHVSTLSGTKTYLGWTNHLFLLSKNGEEIRRREELTKSVYEGESISCDEIKNTLKTEKISYLVFGPLERKKYGDRSDRFGCLNTYILSEEYRVFAP